MAMAMAMAASEENSDGGVARTAEERRVAIVFGKLYV